MPRKEELYMSKPQIQRLCVSCIKRRIFVEYSISTLFQERKKKCSIKQNKKDMMQDEHDDLPNFFYVSMNGSIAFDVFAVFLF